MRCRSGCAAPAPAPRAPLDKLRADFKKEQAEKGFDGLTFFVYRTLLEAGVGDAETASGQIKKAFGEHPNWQSSDAELRELRNDVTLTVDAQMDDLDEVAKVVDDLFNLLAKAYEIG
jgi:type I restriction enzyme R subunit